MINNYKFIPKGGPLAIASPNYKQTQTQKYQARRAPFTNVQIFVHGERRA